MSDKKKIQKIVDILDTCPALSDKDNSDCHEVNCSQCQAERIYQAGYRQMPESLPVLTKEEFFALHEEFFGKGSGTCCEVDDSDLCYRVAKAQIAKIEKLVRGEQG